MTEFLLSNNQHNNVFDFKYNILFLKQMNIFIINLIKQIEAKLKS